MDQLIKKGSALITIIASDIFVIVLAFVIAFFIRDLLSLYITIPTLISDDPLEYQLTNWWIIPLYLTIFWVLGQYGTRKPFWHETRDFVKAIIFGALLIFSVISFTRINPYVSRIIFMLHPFVLALLIPFSRRIIKTILFRLQLWHEPLIEISLDTKTSLKDVWDHNGYIGYSIINRYEVNLEGKENIYKQLEDIQQSVKKIAKEGKCTTGAIIIKDVADKNLPLLIEKLYFVFPHILIIPEFLSFDVINATVYHLMYENMFIFDIRKGLISESNQNIKRFFDIVLSFFGIIILSPVMLIVSLIIYLIDGGPIVYTQQRYGKNGEIFNFMKFRTMYKDNETILKNYLDKNPEAKKEWEAFQKLRGEDPRLIKGLGGFLRKFDLDEIPQLFNVLLGKMSIVGPRPYLPREREIIGDYFQRILAVKPGITGLWQATGRNNFTFSQRLITDTWYIQNWSLWLDLVIVLKTIRKIIG